MGWMLGGRRLTSCEGWWGCWGIQEGSKRGIANDCVKCVERDGLLARESGGKWVFHVSGRSEQVTGDGPRDFVPVRYKKWYARRDEGIRYR